MFFITIYLYHSTESSSYLDPNKLGHSLHHCFDSSFTNIKQFITVMQADIVLDKLFLFYRGAIQVNTVCFNRFWYYDFEGKMTYNHLKVTWQNSIDDRRNITLMEMACPLHTVLVQYFFNFYFNIKYQPSAWMLVNLQPLNNLINKLDKWLIVHTYTNIQFDQHTDFRWL